MYSSTDIRNFLDRVQFNDVSVGREIVSSVMVHNEDLIIVVDAKRVDAESSVGLKSLIESEISKEFRLKSGAIKVIFSNDQSNNDQKKKISNVKKIIAVASGKGGVGKSTVASMLALALSEDLKVGLLDADIYGPSIPYLFNVNKKPEIDQKNHLMPIKCSNIQIMSMGFLVADEKAIIWRGPMLAKALHQMMNGVSWGYNEQLDVLIIDTPPGTGDLHLSLLSRYQIDGVVFVTTPQALAVNDTIKSINMFYELKVPIIGVLENMSYIKSTGEKAFGSCKINIQGIKYLGEIPMIKDIAENNFIKNGVFAFKEELYELSYAVKDYLGST